MQVQIIDPSKDNRWDEFTASHPQGTVFHLSNWARVLQKTYGYIPYYFILEDSDKEIKAGCPFFLIKSWFTGNRLVCLPFTDACFPLATSNEDIKSLFSAAIEEAKREKIDYIEVRGWPKIIVRCNLQLSSHNYYRVFLLKLSQDVDSIVNNFSHMVTRYVVKKTGKSPLQLRKTGSEEDMRRFYELNLLTRKKHGVPPQPYKFFKNIWQEIILEKLGILVLAEYCELPIAGGLFMTYKDIVHYKFNASNASYLKYRPNHFLVWYAIQQACYNGFKYLDFGRTSPDNQGLVRFKRLWGAKQFPLPYYYWPASKGVNSLKEKDLKYRVMTSILPRTPIAVSRAIGELLYKHLG